MKDKIHIKANNRECLHALKRYVRYVFNIKAYVLEKKTTLDDSFVFIDADFPLDISWLLLFHKYSNQKTIILGFLRDSSEVYINLLDLSRIKNNIQIALNRKKTTMMPLLLVKNVEQQIKSLIKPHGERSLYNLLNMTRQAIISGTDLFKKSVINREEYKESYLNPGIESWDFFIKRFNKYEVYLKVCGFESEIEKINRNIINFQEYIEKTRCMKENQIKKIEEAEIKQKNGYLDQIDKILTHIKQKIDSVYDSL